MADVTPGPPNLIIKRIETEIKKIEFQIASQELELLELDERKERVAGNIEALREEMKKQNNNLKVTKDQSKE